MCGQAQELWGGGQGKWGGKNPDKCLRHATANKDCSQILGQPHTLELLSQSTWVLVGSVLFSEGSGRNLSQCSICTKGL